MNENNSNKKSLLGGVDRFFNQEPEKKASSVNGSTLIDLDIDVILANEYQPRTVFDDEKLLELSKSIKENGILQPLTVIINKDGKYELIAGERRLRASKLAGLEKVPVIVKEEVQDEKRSILAIIENLQREDLNCIELANSYKKAVEEFKLTHEELGNKLGIPKANVSNLIRLLALPDKVLKYLEKGKLSLGHGKVLASVKDVELCTSLAEKTVYGGLSVQKLSELIKGSEEPKQDKKEIPEEKESISRYIENQNELSKETGLNFEIKDKKDSGGRLILNFETQEELDNIINILSKKM